MRRRRPHSLGNRAPHRPRARLALESLEGRVVPTFLPAIHSPAGATPTAVVVGDFNEDGHTDLGVSNLGAGGAVALLLGRGDGTFQAPVSHPTGPNARYVVTADFNADEHLDLAVVCRPSTSEPGFVTLLLGNGNGTFRPARQFPTGIGPSGAAVGDFTADNRLDLVVTNYNAGTLSLLRNDGAGGFLPAVSIPAGEGAISVVAADFTADGELDLVVARNRSSGTGSSIGMFHGRGDGTFRPPIDYDTGLEAFALTVGRIDGDATPDVVVAHRRDSNNVVVFRGSIKGGLKKPFTYTAGSSPWSVDLGDFDGDGAADVAVANNGTANMSVLRNQGNATLRPAQHFAAGNGPFAVAVGNFNDDFRPDAVVANSASNTVSAFLNDGDWGGFAGGGPRGDTAAVVATLLTDVVPRRR